MDIEQALDSLKDSILWVTSLRERLTKSMKNKSVCFGTEIK
jgi:hypothetical protein